MDDCIKSKDLKTHLTNDIPLAIIDVRQREEFDAQHISNAINIPLDQLEKLLPHLAKETLFVTVCGKGGGRSGQGAELLNSAGFHAQWLCGGTFGWNDKE